MARGDDESGSEDEDAEVSDEEEVEKTPERMVAPEKTQRQKQKSRAPTEEPSQGSTLLGDSQDVDMQAGPTEDGGVTPERYVTISTMHLISIDIYYFIYADLHSSGGNSPRSLDRTRSIFSLIGWWN